MKRELKYDAPGIRAVFIAECGVSSNIKEVVQMNESEKKCQSQVGM